MTAPKRILLAAMAAGAILSATTARADDYAIDPQHAWVNFTTKHAVWANATGKFGTIAGDISLDKSDPTKSNVAVTIDAASLDTNFADRDRDLKGPDFFNVAEFPKITFQSTSVEKTGDKTAKVTGNLTLIGVTKPVTLDVIFNGEMPLPWDPTSTKAGFSATGKINATDFGMTKVTQFGIGPEVNLAFEIEAYKKK
jgi:polyisoprenoid-binding protein YceI